MGLLTSLFNLADDLVSIPTNLLGITNHHEKKKVLSKYKRLFINGKISSEEYEKVRRILE